MINRVASQPRASSPGPRAETCKSLGLKALFELMVPGRKYSFLDLGPALGRNIEFLTPFSSMIRVENLHESLASDRFFEIRGEAPDGGAIERTLALPGCESFDVVFSWDLINYFRPDELQALMRCLARLCRPGSLVFAMVSTRKEMPAVPTTFRIVDSETLLYAVDSPETVPCPRYTPRDLGLLMTGFQAQRSYLLRNGMQEFLLVRE